MVQADIVKLIESRYIYYDLIKEKYQSKWNELKAINNDNIFFEQLYLFLNNELDPHTKLIDKNKYNFILPLFFTVMNEEIIVVDSLEKNRIKRGYILTHIDNLTVENYIKNNNIDTFGRSKILSLTKVIENISYSDTKRQLNLQFITSNNGELKSCIEYLDKKELINMFKNNTSFSVGNECLHRITNNKIFYVKVPNLKDEIAIRKVLNEIRDKIKSHSILLDIRNNVGGRIDLSIELTGIFLENDTKIYLKGRDGIEMLNITAENNKLKDPVGILFNNMTSSSLEYIFLASLLKNKKILMLGNGTSGMKDVATVYKLSDRYTLVLTTKRYIYKDGQYVSNNGIIPDIEIPVYIDDFNKFPDRQLVKAITIMNENIKNKVSI